MLLKISLLILVLYLLPTSILSQIRLGGKSINAVKAATAISQVAQAVSLSDKDIEEMSREAIAHMDEENTVADSTTAYGQRLKKLTENIKSAGNLPLNFKVYLTEDVNAFACGDGSIRIFSGLMDIMSDGELMAIIGHEIGHVVHTDSKDAMKNAFLTSAARNAVGATNGTLAKLTNSQVGALAQAFSGAQFSQKQEFAADDYGFEFSTTNGFSPYAMADSLQKLVELSNAGGAKASTVQKMFSSHPDSAKRAARMREKADSYKKRGSN